MSKRTHPYTRLSFWKKMQFWERPESLISENGKEYYRKWLSNWINTESNVGKIQDNLK
jgi:hypothetical protein